MKTRSMSKTKKQKMEPEKAEKQKKETKRQKKERREQQAQEEHAEAKQKKKKPKQPQQQQQQQKQKQPPTKQLQNQQQNQPAGVDLNQQPRCARNDFLDDSSSDGIIRHAPQQQPTLDHDTSKQPFSFELFELAQSDLILTSLIVSDPWMRNKMNAIAPWLNDMSGARAVPASVPPARREELKRTNALPQTVDEERFKRNCATLEHIAGRVNMVYPPPLPKHHVPIVYGGGTPNHSYQYYDDPRMDFTQQRQVYPGNPGGFVFPHPAPNQNKLKPVKAPQQEPPHQSSLNPQVPEYSVPRQNPLPFDLRPPGNLPSQSQSLRPPEQPSENTANSISKATAPSATPTQKDMETAEEMKKTVLRPYYDRIQKDSELIAELRQERAELIADAEHKDRQLQLYLQEIESKNSDDGDEVDQPRGVKRKRADPPSPMQMGDATNGFNEHTPEGHLSHLAHKICKDLNTPVPGETIHLCGFAAMKILESSPQKVLSLAHEKLHTWPYEKVPMCWRRLYEDASLAKAAKFLRAKAGVLPESSVKRMRFQNGSEADSPNAWFADVVRALDMGIMLSGAPGRSKLFESVFQQLENNVPADEGREVPSQFNIIPPKQLKTDFSIDVAKETLGFEDFQEHLDTKTTPIVIPGATANWSAQLLWQKPYYFLRQTLGGRRLCPIEIGQSYTDNTWSQKIITIREFFETYLLPAEPKDVGYLAQHDLFAQIPGLKEDIQIPDYCYTTPPPADADTARTAGLDKALQLEQPLLNAWFGPKGTQTPLHTDPYHNILCQVVGYKYVRLYAPSQTPKLYPRGEDEETNISMENTSQVDISKYVQTADLIANGRSKISADELEEERSKFPLAQKAAYVEAVLAPGECLYVPVGWWHYVESLTTSFSVSFWWN